MVSHKVFRRVLKEYFRYILTIEKGCGNECCFNLPFDSIWFNLIYLGDYFDESDINVISHKYFRKIDPDIKRDILARFQNLEPYFKENLWFQKNEPSAPTFTYNFSKSKPSRSGKPYDFTHRYSKPSTSGYKSPGMQSPQNSPIGSRENSPIPTSIQENNSINHRKKLSLQRHNSVNSTENEVHVIEQPKRNNFRQKTRKKTGNFRNTTQPKRKYNKRLQTHPYLNELPENLPPLKQHESNLILQSIDGRQITDLNVPLPICKTVFKQCRKKNPVTKRYTVFEDDGSENVPFNIYLKY